MLQNNEIKKLVDRKDHSPPQMRFIKIIVVCDTVNRESVDVYSSAVFERQY
ncbi:hypothetical protein QJS04_geneDACA015971 [Acorus gramineus]|uniref:Uncharacterized protein n=1 Tax=Acorus gramineus TaxID=55184 RepID=A0AAV9BHM9_ACOGR|nr:hypothetical protein QJS04_geneDACA015971 [Acorus gramineus]